MSESMQDFLEQTHIAVFGASDKKTHAGYKIVHRLKKRGYKVYPVNPRIARVGTMRCYGTLDEIPGQPQGILVNLGPEAALEIVRSGLAHGVRRYWIEPDSVSDELLTLLSENGLESSTELSILEALDA